MKLETLNKFVGARLRCIRELGPGLLESVYEQLSWLMNYNQREIFV